MEKLKIQRTENGGKGRENGGKGWENGRKGRTLKIEVQNRKHVQKVVSRILILLVFFLP